jgi:acetyltransferase-like isoleucine patch superfamily enzyme
MSDAMRMRDHLGRIDPAARVHDRVTLGKSVTVAAGATIYENATIGDGAYIGPNVTIGEPLAAFYSDPAYENPPTEIGPGSIIRSGTVIYAGTTSGPRLQTGHDAMIREYTEFGEGCGFGTFAMSDGRVKFGDGTRIHYAVCISQGTVFGKRVHVYPYAAFPDSLHPPCRRHLEAPVIGDETIILLHAIILPRVKVGARCLVGAHTVVTEDVPDGMAVVGSPGKIVKRTADIPCKVTPGHHPYPWTEAREKEAEASK